MKITVRIAVVILLLLLAYRPPKLHAQYTSISGVVNIYTPVISLGPCPGAIVVQSSGGFRIGDTVVIIQMKGAVINSSNTAAFGSIQNYNGAGNYEFGIIADIFGNTISLTHHLLQTYNISGLVQLIRVPHYQNASVEGLLTAFPWDGSAGGVLAIDVGDVLRLNADIDVSGLGFRGGTVSRANTSRDESDYFYTMASGKGAQKGEGITPYVASYEAGRGALANGGGGGNDHNAGGGGGGNISPGGKGGKQYSGFGQTDIGGLGGYALEYPGNGYRVFLGGGGGGGHQNQEVATEGTSGGGIVLIRARTILGNGRTIVASGIDRVDAAGWDGAGGGGAGGSIFLQVESFQQPLTLRSKGGKGGDNNDNFMTDCVGTGGGGGGGVVWVGTPTPPAGVTVDLQGGKAGIILNASPCINTTYGADSGTNGRLLTALRMPQGNVPINTGLADAGRDTTICLGQSTVLRATGVGGYRWSPAHGLSCTDCPNPRATPTFTTTYYLSVTDPSGCTSVDSVTINVTAIPVDVGGNRTICKGGSTILSASGGVSYLWSPDRGLTCTTCPELEARPLVTTTYYVTVTDAAGCIGRDSLIVFVKEIAVDAGANKTICAGESTNLLASGGVIYQWSPAAGLSCTDCPNPRANPTVTTTYYATIIDVDGCIGQDSVTVRVLSPAIADAGAGGTICLGGSLKLQATGGSIYAWSPAAGLSCTDCANPTASPTVTTVYHVAVTDTNGCTGRDSVTVVVGNSSIDAGADRTICSGQSTELHGSGGVIYAWSPAEGLSCVDCPNPTARPTQTTVYYVMVTDALGCAGRDSVIVTVNSVLADAGADTTICSGQSTELRGSGGVIYAWSPAEGLSCIDCANPTANPRATTTYYVTVTDAAGCSARDSVTVTVATIAVDAGDGGEICLGGSLPLRASGGDFYLWSPSAGLSCVDCATPTASPVATTTYYVTITDAAGCSARDSVTVVVRSLVADAGADRSICPGGSTGLVATGDGRYLWSPSAGLSCVDCATPTASPASTTTYYLTVSDSLGCIGRDSVTVIVNVVPADAGADRSICPGGSTGLVATGGVGYLWSPSAGLSCVDCATPTASPASTTTYYLTVSDSLGCIGRDSVTVAVVPCSTTTFLQLSMDCSTGMVLAVDSVSGITMIGLDSSISSNVAVQVVDMLPSLQLVRVRVVVQDRKKPGQAGLQVRNGQGEISTIMAVFPVRVGDILTVLETDRGRVWLDTTAIGKRRCHWVDLRNDADSVLVISSAVCLQNTSFSIPPGQFPLVIPSGGTGRLEVCFEPGSGGDTSDSIIIGDPCPLFIPVAAYGVRELDGEVCNTTIVIRQAGAGISKVRIDAPRPNPGSAIVEVPVEILGDRSTAIVGVPQVRDALGTTVMYPEYTMRSSTGSGSTYREEGMYLLDVSALPQGVYWLMIPTGDGMASHPILIAR